MQQRAKHPRNIALDQVLPRTARERKKLAKRFRGLFVRAGVAGLYADGRARSRVSVRTIYYDYPRKRSKAIEGALLAELRHCSKKGPAAIRLENLLVNRIRRVAVYPSPDPAEPQVPEPVYETILDGPGSKVIT
jgi:hypothetical protein